MNLLKGVQSNIENFYVNGHPRHHLPSARDPEYNSMDKQQSCIFVVEWELFSKMSTSQIQRIFTNRHILVLNAPLPEEPFNLETLATLRDLGIVMEMQGETIYPSFGTFLKDGRCGHSRGK